MAWPQVNLRNRLIVACILAAAIITLVVATQLVLAPAPASSGVDAATQPGPRVMTPESRRDIYRLAVGLITLLLLTLFFMAVYVLTRIGRALKQPSVGGQPTVYVDAWSQYRLSDEAVEQATHEADTDMPPDHNAEPPE
jgi:hypothetical protein